MCSWPHHAPTALTKAVCLLEANPMDIVSSGPFPQRPRIPFPPLPRALPSTLSYHRPGELFSATVALLCLLTTPASSWQCPPCPHPMLPCWVLWQHHPASFASSPLGIVLGSFRRLSTHFQPYTANQILAICLVSSQNVHFSPSSLPSSISSGSSCCTGFLRLLALVIVSDDSH